MAFDIIPWNPLQYQAESDRIIYSSKKKKRFQLYTKDHVWLTQTMSFLSLMFFASLESSSQIIQISIINS
jgi:hypothetical protein